jgi:hypothetical protein
MLPLAPTPIERRMHASDRQCVGQERIMLLLMGSVYVAAAVLAYVALPEPTPFQDRGLRLLEAAGGSAIGACLPGSMRAAFRTTSARVASAIGVAAVFYSIGPWGRLW